LFFLSKIFCHSKIKFARQETYRDLGVAVPATPSWVDLPNDVTLWYKSRINPNQDQFEEEEEVDASLPPPEPKVEQPSQNESNQADLTAIASLLASNFQPYSYLSPFEIGSKLSPVGS